MLSDLWSPIAEVQAMIAQLAATGAHGHVVQIVDPAEESFPYSGRVEFIEPEGAGSITAGRAETWRNDYQALRGAPPRRHPRRNRPAAAGASPSTAPTGRPSELLLVLHSRMGDSAQLPVVSSRHAPAQPGRAA